MDLEQLRKNGMMAHLMDSMEKGEDIGHYGRLVFVMVARHFLDDETMLGLLCKGGKFSEEEARALLLEASSRGYSPPRREKVLQFARMQKFPICPNPEDPDACNV